MNSLQRSKLAIAGKYNGMQHSIEMPALQSMFGIKPLLNAM